MMDRKMVNFIKEQYPPGTRIRLNSMEDPYAPILPGTEGEVDFVDDKGQIFMKWDNGRTLPLIPGEDSFTVLPPKLTTLKLYMPLTADLYERNEYGDFDDSSTLLEGRELRGYQDQITAALVKNRMPEETERGLMHWYDEADSVNAKVRSAVFAVEERDRQLWGIAECLVAGELSDTEMDTLKEFITGQASDGWGESFEQRDILVENGCELYVHLWNSDEWSIQTEQELFSPKLADGLPELCFSTLPGTGELICIKRGESGYYHSDWNTNDPAHNREIADYKSLVAAEIQTTEPKPEYEKIIKDPYVMEFLQIQPDTHVYEGELEQALIDHLQHFLLELGRGFSFVARQKKFTLDGQNFFIDLVFYNYILKCFVLIDLKMGQLTHQDLGQMQMYVNYYTRELMNEGDTPPIGIVLCADKSDAVVKYTLPEDNHQIFASKYFTYLPTEEELKRELRLDEFQKLDE